MTPGEITGVAPGDTDIAVTLNTATSTATAQFAVHVEAPFDQRVFTLTGIVGELPCCDGTRLEGARVEVLDGEHRGRFDLTNRDGRYEIPDLTGNLNVEVSKAGYASRRAGASPNRTELSFGLRREAPVTSFSNSGRQLYEVGSGDQQLLHGRYRIRPFSRHCYWELRENRNVSSRFENGNVFENDQDEINVSERARFLLSDGCAGERLP